jgi:hypothetical protein
MRLRFRDFRAGLFSHALLAGVPRQRTRRPQGRVARDGQRNSRTLLASENFKYLIISYIMPATRNLRRVRFDYNSMGMSGSVRGTTMGEEAHAPNLVTVC